MEEGQITGMTKDLMIGSKEGQTKEDKTKDQILNLQGSNVLVNNSWLYMHLFTVVIKISECKTITTINLQHVHTI